MKQFNARNAATFIGLSVVAIYASRLFGKMGFVEVAEEIFGQGILARSFGYLAALGPVLVIVGGGGALGYGARILIARLGRGEHVRADFIGLLCCIVSVIAGVAILAGYYWVARDIHSQG